MSKQLLQNGIGNDENRKLFEVTAAGFNGGDDKTDDLVFWVKAASGEEVKAAIEGTGALYHDAIDHEANTSIDFQLPTDLQKMRKKLEGYRDRKVHDSSEIDGTPTNNAAPGRTLVDDFVKDAMLRHFELLPTRMHVLVNLFFTLGNGYTWRNDPDGQAVPVCRFPDTSELRIRSHQEAYPDERPPIDDLDRAAKSADVEFQNLVRDWGRRNIDALSTRYFHFYDLRLPEPVPYEACSRALLSELPDNVHRAWLDAAEEVCDYVAVHINRKTNAHSFDDDQEREAFLAGNYACYLEPYRLVKQMSQRFLAFPQIRERREQWQRLITDVLAEGSGSSGK